VVCSRRGVRDCFFVHNASGLRRHSDPRCCCLRAAAFVTNLQKHLRNMTSTQTPEKTNVEGGPAGSIWCRKLVGPRVSPVPLRCGKGRVLELGAGAGAYTRVHAVGGNQVTVIDMSRR